jgi:DNA-directed RNA polymerase subunit M/transcription elongation factor TFIIS
VSAENGRSAATWGELTVGAPKIDRTGQTTPDGLWIAVAEYGKRSSGVAWLLACTKCGREKRATWSRASENICAGCAPVAARLKIDRTGQTTPDGLWIAVAEDGKQGSAARFRLACTKCGREKRSTWSEASRGVCAGCVNHRVVDRTGQATPDGLWIAVAEDGKKGGGQMIWLLACTKCGHEKRRPWSSAGDSACPGCRGGRGRLKIDRTGQTTPDGLWIAVAEDGKMYGKSIAFRFSCTKCGHEKRATWNTARRGCPTCAADLNASLGARLAIAEAERELDFLYGELWRKAMASRPRRASRA